MLTKFLQNRKEIRSYIRMIRSSVTLTKQYDESNKILSTAFNCNLIYNAKNIACFLSFDGEINTYPLILKLWLKKKNIFLPIVSSIYSRKLFFVPFTSRSILYYNKYNILEPFYNVKDIILESDLDLIIVPLVAFDRKGVRLGMGGGFYDNFLMNWKIKNFIPVGIAYDFQFVNYIPRQPWDISLPVVLTPNKIYFFH
ncbi:5-formyltetrahydrofolate cyclo-ligase [Buchnera aphidicola (Rhopalosiphum padi)]|uniref:5-formyltetrahydrofolate cyclo-ligase n=1 Tax=Buchnera aphidicola subsp. Rhopalosiphum padi TaxID=98793 RepID=A0A4D6Y6U5_BUCRP|nr:5-formyltetrahydrofolate cyclo-ligase [Buchnera aphidicola]QCI25042.1 5-formyltetrahydrofolate cyclo-ligase [Buchnera aphidicola (Rhopalosiphum padi)]